MFEITRTRARWAFKDLLGQANHFLITILVGLNGIRDGSVTINDEFRTSWNPVNASRSAERIRLCHEAVEHFDAHLLKKLPLEQYIKEAIMIRLSSDNADLSHVCRRVWDGHKSREKAIRLLRLVGVRETEQVVGREVPDSFVDRFVSLGSKDALEFLSDRCEA